MRWGNYPFFSRSRNPPNLADYTPVMPLQSNWPIYLFVLQSCRSPGFTNFLSPLAVTRLSPTAQIIISFHLNSLILTITLLGVCERTHWVQRGILRIDKVNDQFMKVIYTIEQSVEAPHIGVTVSHPESRRSTSVMPFLMYRWKIVWRVTLFVYHGSLFVED